MAKGLMKKKVLSEELSAVIGGKTAARTEVVKKLWAYIKKNDLSEGRNITPDEKLSRVLGKKTLTMFDMAKKISAHLSDE